jgi:hypothetical protein
VDDITSREAAKQFKWVGTRPVRPDGVPKVTGLAQYGADGAAKVIGYDAGGRRRRGGPAGFVLPAG